MTQLLLTPLNTAFRSGRTINTFSLGTFILNGGKQFSLGIELTPYLPLLSSTWAKESSCGTEALPSRPKRSQESGGCGRSWRCLQPPVPAAADSSCQFRNLSNRKPEHFLEVVEKSSPVPKFYNPNIPFRKLGFQHCIVFLGLCSFPKTEMSASPLTSGPR